MASVYDWLRDLEDAVAMRVLARQYYNDPVAYARDRLNVNLAGKQIAIANAVSEPPGRVWVNSCNGFGKCLSRHDVVTLADGSRVQAGSLIGEEFELLALVDGKPARVNAKADWNQLEPVYEITTATGLKIIRSGNHPLFAGNGLFRSGSRPIITPLGWASASSFKEGDLIATTEELPAFGDSSLSDEEIKVFAYMIAEGSLIGSACLFTQSPGVRLEEFQECVAAMGCDAKPTGTSYGYSVKDNTGETYGRCRWRKNRVRHMLRDAGLTGKHSRDKFVPDEVCRLPKEKLALFLSRLYGCDGWVVANPAKNGRTNTEVGYCSASERLVRDVASLLIRFGIRPKVRYRSTVNAWCCEFHTREDIEIFVREIGAFGKEEACERAVSMSSVKTKTLGWPKKNAPPGTRWDKVVSVRELPPEMTVAIEVPEHHTFLTDFYEHNSMVSGCLAVWFYDTRAEDCAVLMTAPTDRQVVEVLGHEVRKAWGNRPGIYPKQVKIEEKTTGRLLLGFTAANESSFQGLRRRKTFVVFDEHNGIEKPIYAAARGILTGDETIWLCLGNPTDPGSAARFEEKMGNWHSIRLSSFEHPNTPLEIMGQPPLVPQAVRLSPLLENMKTWGVYVGKAELAGIDLDLLDPMTYGLDVLSAELEDAIRRRFPSTVWRPLMPEAFARILGLYPPQSSYSAFSEALLERARNREIVPSIADRIVIAADIARFGDDASVVFARLGPVCIHHEKFYNRDTSYTAGRLKELAQILTDIYRPGSDPKKVAIYVDDDGVGGGVTDQADGYMFLPIRGGTNAYDTERYVNRRSELHFAAVTRLESGMIDLTGLPNDVYQELLKQAMVVQYNLDGMSRRRIESKDLIKKADRLGYSPDDLDAFVYCFASAGDGPGAKPSSAPIARRNVLDQSSFSRTVAPEGRQESSATRKEERLAHYRRRKP